MLIANLGNTNLRLVLLIAGTPLWDLRLPTAEAPSRLPALPPGCPIALVSVVPDVACALLAAWADHPIVEVTAATSGLAIAYDPPTALGADRLANACALQATIGWGIAVDCGTATTLTVLDRDGVVRGGAIMPGLATARTSLAAGTAQLMEVPLTVPEGPWGTSTVAAIQTGLVHGHVGAVLHLVERARQSLGPDAPVVLTGGFSAVLAPLLPDDFAWEPDLTLQGAQRVWLRGQSAGA